MPRFKLQILSTTSTPESCGTPVPDAAEPESLADETMIDLPTAAAGASPISRRRSSSAIAEATGTLEVGTTISVPLVMCVSPPPGTVAVRDKHEAGATPVAAPVPKTGFCALRKQRLDSASRGSMSDDSETSQDEPKEPLCKIIRLSTEEPTPIRSL
jgi:hypothetical protein